MDCALGVDLGSTTCKAVILGHGAEILGKGVTNTRTDYHMAVKIAVHEAMVNAELNIMGQRAKMGDEAVIDYEKKYRLADYRCRYGELRRRLTTRAEKEGGADGKAMFDTMSEQMDAVLSDDRAMMGLVGHGGFFRDFMYILYRDATKRLSAGRHLDDELYWSLFDRVLLSVENDVLPPTLAEVFSSDDDQMIVDVDARPLIQCRVGTGYGRNCCRFRRSKSVRRSCVTAREPIISSRIHVRFLTSADRIRRPSRSIEMVWSPRFS